MPDDEDVDEDPAIGGVAGGVPGQGNEGGRENGLPELVASMAGKPEGRQGENQRYESFGEDGEAEASSGEPKQRGLATGEPFQEEQHGGAKADGEGQVSDGEMRVGHPSCRGGEDGGSEAGREFAEELADAQIEEEGESEAEEGDGCARGEFAGQTELGAEGGHPIEQGRFLEPFVTPEARRDPVTGQGHLAADGGVARLVWVDHADAGERVEIECVEHRQGE